MEIPTVDVLGIKLYQLDIDTCINQILEKILKGEKKSNRCITATGASGIIHARHNKEFKDILQSFYINLPDGMPSVWVGRAKGAKGMQRCYGPDFFKEMMTSSSDKPINHFLCGGQPGVAELLKTACEASFKNNNIKGLFTPPFRPMTDAELEALANRINALNIDMVWIGISTPKQELLANRLRKYTDVHFIVTVGAAFDFHTGRVKQAPRWIQRNGLEWLFRLIQEPRRLYKRYFTIVPLFIYYNIKELLNRKIANK
jgi:N-acetylglucosaminyldiphosphoundecaprenol N-acetyl-beta-D-mannosaminyltransferase